MPMHMHMHVHIHMHMHMHIHMHMHMHLKRAPWLAVAEGGEVICCLRLLSR